MINKWVIGEIHKNFGKVIGMGVREGEAYRFFIKDGVVSLIPLPCLEEEEKQGIDNLMGESLMKKRK